MYLNLLYILRSFLKCVFVSKKQKLFLFYLFVYFVRFFFVGGGGDGLFIYIIGILVFIIEIIFNELCGIEKYIVNNLMLYEEFK